MVCTFCKEPVAPTKEGRCLTCGNPGPKLSPNEVGQLALEEREIFVRTKSEPNRPFAALLG